MIERLMRFLIWPVQRPTWSRSKCLGRVSLISESTSCLVWLSNIGISYIPSIRQRSSAVEVSNLGLEGSHQTMECWIPAYARELTFVAWKYGCYKSLGLLKKYHHRTRCTKWDLTGTDVWRHSCVIGNSIWIVMRYKTERRLTSTVPEIAT